MAARNYEDFLQVRTSLECVLAVAESPPKLQTVIPVFEGLLPEPHNQTILQLLFHLAHWHGLAKLRMHSEKTLDILDTLTQTLGENFRFFQGKTCAAFGTKELQWEADKRYREKVKGGTGAPANSVRKPKGFKLNTYKFHSLGDYVETIRMLGTTDSYSTEPVSLP